MVFLRCNAAGALITTLPPRNVMKKLFPTISSCNINYETRKVPCLGIASLVYISFPTFWRSRQQYIFMIFFSRMKRARPSSLVELIRIYRVLQAVKILKTSRSKTGLGVLCEQFGAFTKEMLTLTRTWHSRATLEPNVSSEPYAIRIVVLLSWLIYIWWILFLTYIPTPKSYPNVLHVQKK